MPPVINTKTGESHDVSDDVAARMVSTGRFHLGKGASVRAVSKGGAVTSVTGSQLKKFGQRVETDEETLAAQVAARQKADYGDGFGNKAKALGEGFASGLTLGLADPFLDDEATDYRKEHLGALRFVGDIAGMAAPIILTGGAAAPGAAGRIAARGALEVGAELAARGAVKAGAQAATRGTVRQVLGRALQYTPAGMVGRGGAAIAEGGGIVRSAASAAFEGAAGNAGFYLSDVALGDRDLSAEGFVGAMGEGALWGAAAGGAGHALEKAAITARHMFPKLAGKTGKASAEAAEETFSREAGGLFKAGDDTAALAKKKLEQFVGGADKTIVKTQRETTKQALSAITQQKAEVQFALAKALQAGDKQAATAARATLADLRVREAEVRLVKRPGDGSVDVDFGAEAPANDFDVDVGDLEGMPTTTLPKGFGRGPHVTDDAPIYEGVPAPGAINEDAIYVAHPRDFADRVEMPNGPGGERGRVDRLKKGLTGGGANIEPIDVAMRRDGTMEIVGGRHRLVAAAELDQPVAIRFSRGIEEVPFGAKPMNDTAGFGREHLPDRPFYGPQVGRAYPQEFRLPPEAQQLDGALARFEEKRAAVNDWVQRTRKQAAGGRAGIHNKPVSEGVEHAYVSRTGGYHDAEGRVVGRDEYMAARPDDRVARDRPQLSDVDESSAVYEDYNDLIKQAARETDEAARESYIRQAADLETEAFDASPRHVAERVRAARERLSLDAAAVARARVEREIEFGAKAGKGYKPSDKVLGERADEALFTRRLNEVGVPSAADEMARDVARLHSSGGQGALVRETDEAVKILGDYERAHTDLVEKLGTEAPPVAQEAASQYKAAVEDQARKSTDRMAQIADDTAEEAAASPAQKAKRGKKGLTKEVEVPTEERASMFGRAADIGTAIEVLQTMGIPGVPDLDKLPIIGPILSLFLKARAARSVMGRMGGKVQGTVEAVAASKASQVRDRVAKSVDRMLEVGAKVVRKAAPTAGLLAGTLAHKLYDDGDTRPAAKTPTEAVKHRVAELAAAQRDPDGVRRAVRRAVAGAHDPDLVRAIEEATLRKLGYLAQHMPKEPPPSLLGRKDWTPSKSEIERFARRVKAAEDPAAVFEDLAHGLVTPEGAGTLRAVYPQLYAEAQMRLIERAAELTETLPYQRIVKLSLLFDAPLVPSMQPERIAAYQEPDPAAAQGPQPGMPAMGAGPPVNLDALYMDPATRRAMR